MGSLFDKDIMAPTDRFCQRHDFKEAANTEHFKRATKKQISQRPDYHANGGAAQQDQDRVRLGP